MAIISRQEAAELFALRGLLEGFAAREFAQRATDVAIVHFAQAIQALRMAGMTKDRAKVLKAKTDLYDVLLDNCGNGLVKETLTSLHSRINLLRATSLMDPQRLPVSINEIDDLYQALKRGIPMRQNGMSPMQKKLLCGSLRRPTRRRQ